MPDKIKNVSKAKSPQPVLDRSVPFKIDVILFWMIQTGIATVLFFLFSYGLTSSPYITTLTKFFSILGIYLVTDTIAGYISSFLVTSIFKKTYNTAYFKYWFTGTRRSVLRLVIWWVFSALIYVLAIDTGLAKFIWGTVTLWTNVITYLVVKVVAFALTALITKFLLELKPE